MNIMKKLLTIIATFVLTGIASPANAGDFSDLRVLLTAARESLVSMLVNKDKRGADQQKW